MLVEVNGLAHNYQVIHKHLGRSDETKYGAVVFSDDHSREHLAQIADKLSQSDAKYMYLYNVLNKRKKNVTVISGLVEDMKGVVKYEPTDYMPDPNFTHIVRAFNPESGDNINMLVLAEHTFSAESIAISQVRRRGEPSRKMEFIGNHITPEEFVELARLQIDAGEVLNEKILSFAGLKKYADEREKRRA